MNILYVANTCSREKYREYIESKGSRGSQQAQKYNLLLAEGLAACGANVRMISTRPINRAVDKRRWFKGERERVNGVEFRYVPFINYPIWRNICLCFGVFGRVLFSRCKRNETAIVCDALNISATFAAYIAAALRGFKTVGIVTDVPGQFSGFAHLSRNQKLNLSIMRRSDSFLLLTEQMNEIVNPKGRPYIVLEGHADTAMAQVENVLSEKAEQKICLYAGSLMKVYGIGYLVEGFIKANVPNTELHVYGDGNFVPELTELCKQYPQVKYHGIAPNTEIVKAELAATLLVNPRPTNEEFTKYSFPSKNMEYMASGTPVLTTKLPGMPADHLPHVYLIEDETADGIANVLGDLLTRDASELHEKGRAAKAFILEEKNNVSQAKKLLGLLESLV